VTCGGLVDNRRSGRATDRASQRHRLTNSQRPLGATSPQHDAPIGIIRSRGPTWAVPTARRTGKRRILPRVDHEHAQELLQRQRSRIERDLAAIQQDGPLEGSDQREPGDGDSQNLYQDELDAGRIAGLRDELAAVERAEARLEAGTYGLSVLSGNPIPDRRLEAVPTAERTVDEERGGGGT
jgi:DnaK suppressor protein